MAGIVVATLTLALLKWVTALFSLDDTADFLLSSVADGGFGLRCLAVAPLHHLALSLAQRVDEGPFNFSLDRR